MFHLQKKKLQCPPGGGGTGEDITTASMNDDRSYYYKFFLALKIYILFLIKKHPQSLSPLKVNKANISLIVHVIICGLV